MRSLFLASLLSAGLALPAQQPTMTADAIMAKVAENQDRAEAERAHFVYTQHTKVLSRKGKTVMCEEVTDYRVTPKPKGEEQTLLKLDGRVLNGKNYVRYTEFPVGKNGEAEGVHIGDDMEAVKDADHDGVVVQVKETDIDLVENMRKNLTQNHRDDDRHESKNGVEGGLFPLTTAQMKDHEFKLLGRELKNGRDTFHISFAPKDKDDYGWKGDAWIDSQVFQPVVIRTKMSKNLPLAVRMLLGTNVPGLGFTIVYGPQQDGIWFPTSFGTEFKVSLFFVFHREIVLSAENRDFEKTHTSSRILEAPEEKQ